MFSCLQLYVIVRGYMVQGMNV